MRYSEQWFNVFFVLLSGVLTMGAAFTDKVIDDGAQGFLIGVSIFAFILGNDMLKDLK